MCISNPILIYYIKFDNIRLIQSGNAIVYLLIDVHPYLRSIARRWNVVSSQSLRRRASERELDD
jgi:hypothetical protein